MANVTHSVTLDQEKCKGCINCIKKCPTEAIRVRNGKATIMSDRCIDCGECIRICPQHAKKAIYDPLTMLQNFKYNIALPAPTLYGQFRTVSDINFVLTALLEIGFDDVFEVALAAQSIADCTKQALPGARDILRGPVISSACPAVVKLISIRFPELIDSIIKIIAPVELAAIAARREAVEKTGLSPAEIGVFFISPCPAKITASKYPIGYDVPVIDGILSMSEVYRNLVSVIDKIKEPKKLSKAGLRGIGWAASGGEGRAIGEELFIAVDGIENVIKVLDEVENGKMQDVKFIEFNACPGGCVGGCLTVENPFVARARIKRLTLDENKEKDKNSVDLAGLSHDELFWQKKLEYEPIMRLDVDRSAAMRKMADIERIVETLPGIDCGSCGAPSCRSLAEDIVMGTAEEGDCVFKLRERMSSLFKEMTELQEYMPPPFREAQGDGQITNKKNAREDKE